MGTIPATVGELRRELARCEDDQPVTAEVWTDSDATESDYPDAVCVSFMRIDGALHVLVVTD